jgi:uracil-DNA glycosylase family protein
MPPSTWSGEQPGDAEDRAGRPFVGPAGRLLDRALIDAGVDRDALYVTNAVKHFKWEPRGKRRLHKTPAQREVDACRRWLDGELAAIDPALVICLGATAARALLGATATITKLRGKVLSGRPALLVTTHPSTVLRVPVAARDSAYAALVADLRIAASYAAAARCV